jgi:glutaminyl-peptide cyclotransferase
METLVLLDLLGAPDPSIPSYFTTTNWLFEELVASERRLSEAGLLYPSQDQATNKKSFFRSGFSILGGIEDDHLPFLANGVPILHLIPSPFPRVWHTLKDDATALDYPTNYAWAMIIRLFVSEFLQLDLNGVKPSEITARWAEIQEEQKREEESWGEEEDQPGKIGTWAAKGHVTSRSEEELASTI